MEYSSTFLVLVLEILSTRTRRSKLHKYMGVGSRPWHPFGDFHIWYRYSRQRFNSAISRYFFAIFRSFFAAPTPLEEA